MKRIKLCGLFVALSALLLTGLFSGSSVSAASPYDDVIQPGNFEIWDSFSNPQNSYDIGSLDNIMRGTGIDSCEKYDSNAYHIVIQWGSLYQEHTRGKYHEFVVYQFKKDSNGNLPSLHFTGVPYPTHGNSELSIDYSNYTGATNEVFVVNLDSDKQLGYYCTTASPTGNQVAILQRGGDTGPFRDNYVARPLSIPDEFAINYPEDYEGETAPGMPAIKENLWPEYSWNITKDGELTVKYLGNLKHFLTGTSYLVIEKMTDEWENVDENLDSITVQPAGWLDEKYTLPGAGYYMLRIDHNQQLDSPPWPAEHNFGIEQVYIQFYWNGKSVMSGDNIGGCEGICNDQRGTHNNKILKAIDKVQFNDGGLAELIFAPIEFVAKLPGIVNSCQPINLPILGENVSLTCVRPAILSSPLAAVYGTISVLITGMVTWWVAWKTFGTIKNIQDPQDDKVEVLKL